MNENAPNGLESAVKQDPAPAEGFSTKLKALKEALEEANATFDGEKAGEIQKEIDTLNEVWDKAYMLAGPAVVTPSTTEVPVVESSAAISAPSTTEEQAAAPTPDKGLSPREKALESLRALKAKENELGEAYRNNPLWKVVGSRSMESLDEKTRAEVRALNAEYDRARGPLDNEILSATEKYDEMKIDETEVEMKKYIAENPSKRTLNEVTGIANRKTNPGEGYYSRGDDLMADANVILSSGLKNEEKLAILKGLSGQIESWVIGDDKSNLLKRYMKSLSAA